MRIIALDGASGTGKSRLVKRIGEHCEAERARYKGRVRIERLIPEDLEKELDEFKKSGSDDRRREFCERLIEAYGAGIQRLQNKDMIHQRNSNPELVFILDRYLLSLYAIQGLQWGIDNLYERCKSIPKPSQQFIIRLAGVLGEWRPEDKIFKDAADEWKQHGFLKGAIDVENYLSYDDNNLDDRGLSEVIMAIDEYLNLS